MKNALDLCQNICQLTRFTGKTYESEFSGNVPHFRSNEAYLEIFSTHSTQVIEEEYFVYDLTAMIGSLGGSLGLLVGFSFFNVICTILDHVLHNFKEPIKTFLNLQSE